MPTFHTHQITAAVSQQVLKTVNSGFLTSSRLTFACTLTGASGGTHIKAYMQTSINGGAAWYDIACFAFTDTPGEKFLTVDPGKAVETATALTLFGLADNTARSGFLGEALRLGLDISGTYTGTPSLTIDYQTA